MIDYSAVSELRTTPSEVTLKSKPQDGRNIWRRSAAMKIILSDAYIFIAKNPFGRVQKYFHFFSSFNTDSPRHAQGSDGLAGALLHLNTLTWSIAPQTPYDGRTFSIYVFCSAKDRIWTLIHVRQQLYH